MQYFKHMANMRHDLKIKKLINKYGLKGYGLYNLILESITENLTTESPVPDLEETCDDIADLYNENSTEINEIACYMINCGLLETDEVSTQLTCNKVYKFLESSQTRSETIRAMIIAFKERNNSNCSLVSDIRGTSQTFVKEQEQEKNKNRIDKEAGKKKLYLDSVMLYKKEYERLVDKHGDNHTSKMIERLNIYKQSSGKKYKSDYHAILSWVVDAMPKEENKEIVYKRTECESEL